MTDEDTKSPDEAAADDGDDRRVHRDALDEVAALGNKLGDAILDAWGSDKRRHVQARVLDELKQAGDQFHAFAKQAGGSRAGRELQENAEKVGRRMGEGLLSGLRALNKELSRVLEEDERAPDGDKPTDD